MTKKRLECPKYLKTLENDQNAAKQPQYSQKILKWPKYHWNLKNKQNTIETFENDQNTPKLSQNTCNFLDFGVILGDLKLFCSF